MTGSQRCLAHAARSDDRCRNAVVFGSSLCHAHGGSHLSKRPPEPDAVPATGPQLRYLHAILRRSDVDYDDRHAWATEHTGRKVDSLADLTMDEASRLLDELERDDKARQPVDA